MSSNHSSESISGEHSGRMETYYCNVEQTLFQDDPDYDSVEFSPRSSDCYEWQLVANKSSAKEISISVCSQFMDTVKDKILSTSYKLSVENSEGILMQQWRVETTIHSEREIVISHVVDCEKHAASVVYLSLTFTLLPMKALEAVPKRCMPITTKVRCCDNRQLGVFQQHHQEERHRFRSLWIVPNTKIESFRDNETLYEKEFSLGEEPGYSLSIKVHKGSVSMMILTEFFRTNNSSASCKVRYDLMVENARKDRIANWNIDCDFSTTYRLLHIFPLTDVVSSSLGNLSFYLNGSLNEVVPYDDRSSKTGLSLSGSKREVQYYTRLLHLHPFSDVVFAVYDSDGRHTVRSHRAILAARSAVFEKMLESDKDKGVIEIRDLNLNCVQNVLDHIYSGKFDDNMELPDAKALLHAAHRFELTELKNLCELKLMRSVRIHNALELFQASEVSCANDLQNVILDFICENKPVINAVNEMLRSPDHGLTADERYKLMTELIFRSTTKIIPE